MNRSRSHLLCFVAMSLLACSASGPAAAAPKPVKRLEQMLLSIHEPPTAEALKEVSEDVVDLLEKLYRDPDTGPTVRLRALEALSHFPEPGVKRIYQELLAAPGTPEPELLAAITGALFAFKEEAADMVAPLLEHEEVQVRLTTVQRLASHGGEKGRQHLLSAYAREAAPLVRKRISELVQLPGWPIDLDKARGR